MWYDVAEIAPRCRGKSREELKHVTLQEALNHPNWSMGKKITVDSATLLNKGLEFIEAMRLYRMEPEKIQVVVHPESVIHSMVDYEDGAVIAQLGTPDMKLPIQYALYYPERRYLPGERLDFWNLGKLDFEKPDTDTFYGLALAYEAGRRGGSLPTVFNAANERAVQLFLERKIGYLEIPKIIKECMERHKNVEQPSLEEILDTEEGVYEYINSRK